MTVEHQSFTEEVVGAYLLQRRLGRGGSAEVFAAIHRGAAGFERPVCVKRILESVTTNQPFRDTFYREVHFSSQLRHANIVQVFDCLQQGGTVGLVMELVDGMDLKVFGERARTGGYTVPETIVAYIAGQILLGLAYAHERGIIHRDISPHNVLVSREGEIKLTDFGIATTLATVTGVTGTVQGKLAYMSPEQARGERVDHRTDLYSAGLILYELLVGERFFERSLRWHLIHTIAQAPRATLVTGDPRLRQLIEGLLEPEVTARLASAAAALSLLPPWVAIGPAGALELAGFIELIQQEQLVEPDARPTDAPTPPLPFIPIEPRFSRFDEWVTSSVPGAATPPAPHAPARSRRWLRIGALLLGVIMVFWIGFGLAYLIVVSSC